jgi:hypothetical protein
LLLLYLLQGDRIVAEQCQSVPALPAGNPETLGCKNLRDATHRARY